MYLCTFTFFAKQMIYIPRSSFAYITAAAEILMGVQKARVYVHFLLL